MEIGEALKDMGLTQSEVAQGIVTESFYYKVERGAYKIDAETLIKIISAHDVDPINFFNRLGQLKNNTSEVIMIMNIFLR